MCGEALVSESFAIQYDVLGECKMKRSCNCFEFVIVERAFVVYAFTKTGRRRKQQNFIISMNNIRFAWH